MSRTILAITLCLFIALSYGADLRRMAEDRASGAYQRPVVAAASNNVANKAAEAAKSASNDQETASSFYGVGFYGPGYGFGGPFGFGGGWGGWGGWGYGGYGGFPYGGFWR